MPYKTNAALPAPIRAHLPAPAQTIYRNVFNSAWQRYRADPRHEEIAHRSAWAAVKRAYRKADGDWVPKTGHGTKLRTARAAKAP
ncbi:MAG: cation transporter [Acidimicrobiia bacterium]|nr:cation transporter [Acidimicrobiia bacterium]